MINIETIKNKITHADCLEVMKQLPDKCIDLVLTDPPYGINVAKTGRVGGSVLTEVKDYGAKDWDSFIPDKQYFDEILRVSKNQIIFGGNYFVECLHNSSCWIVWDKLNGDNNFADCELAWTSFKTAVRRYTYRWAGMLQQDMKNKEIRIHPTQKPVKLFEMILRDYALKTNENPVVMDCFSGSGTTALACHNLNIPFVCIEKEFDYWDSSSKRLEDTRSQLKLFF